MDRYLRLFTVKSDGTTLYEQCVLVESVSGKWPETACKPIDEDLFNVSPIWNLYWGIRKRVPSGFSGANPILLQDLINWELLYKVKLSALFIHILFVLDDKFIEFQANSNKKSSKKR